MGWWKEQIARFAAKPTARRSSSRRAVPTEFYPDEANVIAEMARCLTQPDAWEAFDNQSLLNLAFHGLVFYGATSDADMVPDLFPLYMTLLDRTEENERLELYSGIARVIEKDDTGLNAMMPFLMLETAASVVSTAVLDYVLFRDTPNGDPLYGAREAIEWIEKHATSNRGAMFGGLITVGDDRIHALLEPLRDTMTEDEVNVAVRCRSGFPAVSTFAFWLDWLETLSDRDSDAVFGSVASGLVLLRKGMKTDFFFKGRRPLGAGTAVKNLPPRDSEDVVSIEEMGKMYASRLYSLEANEAPPKVVSQVLLEFGLEPRAALHERFTIN